MNMAENTFFIYHDVEDLIGYYFGIENSSMDSPYWGTKRANDRRVFWEKVMQPRFCCYNSYAAHPGENKYQA